MSDCSRRSFLIAAGAAAQAATGLVYAAGEEHSLKTVGVELYTVRSLLPQKAVDTLQELERIGYREAEMSSANLDAMWAAFQQTKIKPVAMHVDTALFGPEKSTEFGALTADAKRHGVEYLVYPYVAPNKRSGLEGMRKLAQTLNSAGERCKAAGLEFCYHNHAFEFEPMEGSTPLHVLMDETHKELVGLEMDVFWVSVGGNDPVELLKKYSGRVPLMHLKDKPAGLPVQYNESMAKTDYKEVGGGTLDFAAILRTASGVGVKHYFVEQDQTPGDPLASLRQSFDYLRRLKF
jgi:sugar phosphate isomerase/epimerase